MKKFDSKKYVGLFARDKAVHKAGSALTFLPLLLLVVAIFLSAGAGDDTGLFEGTKLAAFIIIVCVVLFELAFWSYFLAVRGAVKKALIQRQYEEIKEKKNLSLNLPLTAELVFRHKNGKNFSLFERKEPNRILRLNFDEFVSLEEGDIQFYQCFAKALLVYFDEAIRGGLLVDKATLTADYPDKKAGTVDFLLVENGKINPVHEKTLAKTAKKIL